MEGEEELEGYEPMTADVIERIIKMQMDEGKSELEAYRAVMYIMGVKVPQAKEESGKLTPSV